MYYFRHMTDHGVAASTVPTTRSALVKILEYGFGFNLHSSFFASIPRVCAKRRPAARQVSVNWSLNSFMAYALSLSVDSLDYQKLLQQTFFLIALASGGRGSKIYALSRDPTHILILNLGEVLVSHDFQFLAKSEDPINRWFPWKIVPLLQEPDLCLVAALKAYLKASSVLVVENCLGDGTVELCLCRELDSKYFILYRQANRNGFLKDMMATSVSFRQHMSFNVLCKYTHRKSTKGFYNYYYKHIETRNSHALAASKVVVLRLQIYDAFLPQSISRQNYYLRRFVSVAPYSTITRIY